jgi:hypothetical protein
MVTQLLVFRKKCSGNVPDFYDSGYRKCNVRDELLLFSIKIGPVRP